MPSNERRARWADHALTTFQIETRTDRQDALPDLLCDLMHLADREEWDFEKALQRAEGHYREEVAYPEPDHILPKPRQSLLRRAPT